MRRGLKRAAETPAKSPKRQLGSEPTMRPVPKPASRLGVSLLQKKPPASARRLEAMAAASTYARSGPPPAPFRVGRRQRQLSHTPQASFPAPQLLASREEAGPFHDPPANLQISPPARAQPEQEEEEEAEEHAERLSANQSAKNQMDLIKSASRLHSWHWDETNKSHECIVSQDKLEVCFHPQCSESAAAIIGSQPLKRNGNYYYWEVTVFDKTYGTSVMFGLCTKQQQLHANDYCNLIGLDKNGWSLSHKGLIWHDGKYAHYTRMFPPNQTVTLGLLFNTMRGELSYFMDGVNMGVAFCGLNNTAEDLYPVVGSTAKCTRMKLLGAYCGYVSLLERSCFTLLKKSSDKFKFIQYLKDQKVPKHLVLELAELAEAVCGSQTKNKTDQTDQYSLNNNNQQLVKD